MRIDCHCHIFDNECVPVGGMLASRFGIAIGEKAVRLVKDLKKGHLEGTWQDYFRDFSINPLSIIRTMADTWEKDNLLFILNHLNDFFSFLSIGIMDMSRILQRMGQNAPEIDIFVPLMMDMTHAYPGSNSVRSLENQRAITSRLTLEARGRIMPFYAFDPGSGPADPLKKLKTAIETQGFIGVKLYPPLGFKPIGNDDQRIEDALMGLYEYCCKNIDNPIPITAHCSWSAGVYSNRYIPGVNDTGIKKYYRDMACPSHWEKVLKNFPELKLNLAHFGGLGEWEAMAKGENTEENWISPIIDLMEKYDNVYTDLSFHGLPATDLAGEYKRLLLQKITGIENRILLGSDWYMSRMQCSLKDYWRGFKTLSPNLYEMATGINAVSFLKSDASTTFFPDFFASNDLELLDKYKNVFQT